MSKLDFDKMDLKEHSHVPYLVVLYKYLQTWMEVHDGKLPATYKDRQEFKELIRKGKINILNE